VASAVVVTFFSFWNNEPQGNIFAICILVYMLCYSLIGGSLCISTKMGQDSSISDEDRKPL
jgi:hypothetical protein